MHDLACACVSEQEGGLAFNKNLVYAVSLAEHVAVDAAPSKGDPAESAAAAAAFLASSRPPISVPWVPHPQGLNNAPPRLYLFRHPAVKTGLPL